MGRSDESTEVEFSVTPGSGAASGVHYCFRLTDAGSTSHMTFTDYAEAQMTVFSADLQATHLSDTLTRVQQSGNPDTVTADHSLQFDLPAGYMLSGHPVTVHYADFTLSASGSGPTGSCTGSGSVSSVVFANSNHDLTISGDCVGTVKVIDFRADNPGSTGSKVVTITGYNGGTIPPTDALEIYIVDKDQVFVTATVNPALTFQVGVQVPTDSCTTAFASGGTVDLGELLLSHINSSDVTDVQGHTPGHICTTLSSNALYGTIVTVSSTNSALKSGAHTIPSVTALMSPGTANYGLCTISSGGPGLGGVGYGDAGVSSPNHPVPAGLFAHACAEDLAGGTVQGLTTAPQEVWHVGGATLGDWFEIEVKAAISPTTPSSGSTPYTDTLTFVATGTF
jgi:hypothetical protein